ncbi:MAG: hypothetical protein ACK2UO_06155, partial [Caldilineaceae bacterium]
QNAHAWAYKAFSELCIYGAAKAPFKEDGRLEVSIVMDVVALCKNVKSAQQCDAGEGNSGTVSVDVPAKVDQGSKSKGVVYVGCKFNDDGSLYQPQTAQEQDLYDKGGCVPEGEGHCISMAPYDLHYTYALGFAYTSVDGQTERLARFGSCRDTENGCMSWDDTRSCPGTNGDSKPTNDEVTAACANECASDADCLFVAENSGLTCDTYNSSFNPLGNCVDSTAALPRDRFGRIKPHEHLCSSSDPNKIEIEDTATADFIENDWTLYKFGSKTALEGTDVCQWDGAIDPKTCEKAKDAYGDKIETWTCSETIYK